MMNFLRTIAPALLVLMLPLFAGGSTNARDGGTRDEILDKIAAIALKGELKEVVEAMEKPLAAGTIFLGDLTGILRDAEPSARRLIAKAGRKYLTADYILRDHKRWHPKDKGNSGLERTSAFLHYQFLYFEATALMESGKPAEAVECFAAIEPYSTKSAIGLSRFPYEAQFSKALNELGQHARALDVIGPLYALAGQGWMLATLEQAYAGAGYKEGTLDDYLAGLRAKLSAPMRTFVGTDYDGIEVSYEDLKGDVTLLMTWFPGCYGCAQEMPFLQELHERYGDRGFSVIAIETNRDTAAASAYQKKKYDFATFPFLENGKAGEEIVQSYLGANGNATYLIDKHDRVVLAWAGWGRHLEPELEKRVQEELECP